MLEFLNSNKKFRNMIILSCVWIGFALIYLNDTVVYLNNMKNFFIANNGKVGGLLLFFAHNLIFFMPFVIFRLLLSSIPTLLKLDYLITIHKFKYLKVFHEILITVLKCISVLITITIIFAALKSFGNEYIQHLLNDLNVEKLNLYWTDIMKLDPFTSGSLLYLSVSILPRLYTISLIMLLNLPILFIESFPLLTIFIILTVSFHRIYNLYKYKLKKADSTDSSSDLEMNNNYVNIGFPEKEYNLIIEKVGSKELLAKITAKIRQLEELKKI